MKKIGILILSVFLLVACNTEKTPTTVEDFSDYANEMEMTIVDASDQFPEGVVESVTLAYNEDFQIEFYVVPTSEQAESAFEENISAFKQAFTGSESHATTEIGNNSRYGATDDNYYYVVSRINNTFFYCVAEKQYKDAIKTFLEYFDY